MLSRLHRYRTEPCAAGGRAGGFTLLEALAALMLMAIVLPVAMRGISLAAQMGAMARDRDQAVALAEEQLTQAIVTEAWRSGDDEGAFDPSQFGSHADRFTWELLVDDWEASMMKEVTVQVFWRRRGEDFSVSLATVVYTEDD